MSLLRWRSQQACARGPEASRRAKCTEGTGVHETRSLAAGKEGRSNRGTRASVRARSFRLEFACRSFNLCFACHGATVRVLRSTCARSNARFGLGATVQAMPFYVGQAKKGRNTGLKIKGSLPPAAAIDDGVFCRSLPPAAGPTIASPSLEGQLISRKSCCWSLAGSP